MFGIGGNLNPNDIQDIKIHKSQLYALGPVYSFNYRDNHYYLVDDYSLDNNPIYVRNIIEEINHLLKGTILTSPDAINSNSQYAVSINNTDYYLWQSLAS